MNEPTYRVLLIEDNSNDVTLLRRALRKVHTVFEVTVAANLDEAMRAIAGGEWSVILTDLSLPDSTGLDTVHRLRAQASDVPMIVLTGLASDETALASLDHGAQDYLVKDGATPEILERSIRYAVQRQKSAAMRRMVEKLQASERALEKKNRRLARLYNTAHRFVDNVSHEFRTPLTVVNEYVSLLRDGVVGESNDEQKRMLDVIGDRAEDLNNMVDDMLDISKLEAGMLGLWRKQCRVVDIINHVRSSLIRKSVVKDVELQFEIPDDLPEIYCDDEKVGRIIINLTVNAIKFCGQPGFVRVWAKYDEDQREVSLGVTDNGDGISPDNLAVVFRRFKQVGSNPRGSTKGFGLGLNIAKELAHLNFGEIFVKSEVGKGSTFWFSIPLADPLEVMSRYVNRIAHFQNGPTAVSLVSATFAEPADGALPDGGLADDVNTFLNTLMRRHDLVFRTGETAWLLAVASEPTELDKLFKRCDETRERINRNRIAEPLPPIALETLGTWLVPHGTTEILEAVARAAGPLAVGSC